MGSNLEELARKGRQLSADQQAAAKRKRQRRARIADRQTRRRLDRALGASNKIGLIMLAVMVPGILGGVIGISVVGPPTGIVIAGGFFVAEMVAVLVISFVLPERIRNRELDRLEALPFEFDVDRYLGQLNAEHMSAVAEVTAELASDPPDGVRETLSNAVVGAAGGGKAKFHGHKLSITSPKIDTWFRGSGDSSSYHSNHKVHLWFHACTDGLLAVHTEYPVERVDIKVRSA
jgi:hypothetical protein